MNSLIRRLYPKKFSFAGIDEAGLIALSAVICYFNTFNTPFYFDDLATIVDNNELKDPAEIKKIWDYNATRFVPYYSLSVNYSLGASNVFGYHLFNITLHILNSFLVYCLAALLQRAAHDLSRSSRKLISGKGGPGTPEGAASLFCGLLFALHPLQTQAVTYIVQRCTGLMAFLYLLCLTMYLKFALVNSRIGRDKEKRGRLFFLISISSAILAMYSKQNAFTLPITGLCFSLSCLTGYWTKPIHSIFVHNREMKVRRTFELRHFIAFLIPLIVFGLCAIERNRIWINDLTLWSDNVAKSPRKARPHNNLGKALADRSEWGPAIREYQRAIRADSEYFIAYDNLGVAYASMGLYNKAIPEYKEAIRLNKSYDKAHNNLGTTYFNLGRFVDAAKEYEQSLSLKYDYPSSHYNLANTYAATENYDEAIREYKIAIGLNPAFAAAHDNLGLVYSLLNRREEALEEWKRALEIDPGFKAARRGASN